MTDFHELMRILSVPRPAGSAAERRTVDDLLSWLKQRAIPHQVHTFRIYPYFIIAIGVWLIVSRSLLAWAVWQRWGWWALLIALLGLPGGLLDVTVDIPLVSWPGAQTGRNLLVQFAAPEARQEVMLSAHYDTKTELLDHRQRLFFLKKLPLGILLTVLLGLLGPLDQALLAAGSGWAVVTYELGILFSLALLYLAWGLGLSMALGRLRRPSQGAVDNGAACAILLGLAEKLQSGQFKLEHTRLTLALFAGEEVNMQGSRAYVKHRQWDLPIQALNLEVLAQDGDYVYWEQDGNALKLVPCAAALNQAVAASVAAVTGAPAKPAGPLNSDGYSFLRYGIPATTLGTYDRKWVDRGFHGATDNLERVVMARLPEGVEILENFLISQDHAAPDVG